MEDSFMCGPIPHYDALVDDHENSETYRDAQVGPDPGHAFQCNSCKVSQYPFQVATRRQSLQRNKRGKDNL